MTMLYLSAVVLLAVIVVFAIRNAPRLVKLTGVLSLVLLVVGFPYAYLDTLARAKHLDDEWFLNPKTVQVMAFIPVPGVAVYYIFSIPGVEDPRLYYEDWTEEAMKRVQEMQDAKARGEGIAWDWPMERSYEKNPGSGVYGLPQPAPPQKEEPEKAEEFSL